MIKTIQAVSRYFPDSCGGIQTHLSELLPALKAQGIKSRVAASQDTSDEDRYALNGTEIYRYPVFHPLKTEPNHGAFPHGGFEFFARWLKAQKASLYHQHQWMPKCGLPHLRFAKELGLATIVSIHLPQPLCQKQTLMLNNTAACDGRIDVVRCSRCCGISDRLPAAFIQGLSKMPVSTGVAAAGMLRRLHQLPNAIQTVAAAGLRPVALPVFVAARQQGLQEMAKFADRIVVMSQWQHQALLLNGIPAEKLCLIRQGVAVHDRQRPDKVAINTSKPLKIGFLGRWDRTKGIHVLVEAMQQMPLDVPIELIIHGVEQDRVYKDEIVARIANDPRIRVAPQLSREEIPQALSKFDLLAVPSQWLETGPLVVLEAHAHGVPVIGSDLGGIAERIAHGVDGLLVRHYDAQAWADALAVLAADRGLLKQLTQGIGTVRSLAMEATELADLYHQILGLNQRQLQSV